MQRMESRIFFTMGASFLILALVTLTGSTEGTEKVQMGELVPVDVNDIKVQNLAQFVVLDYAQKTHESVKLVEVTKALMQVVNGFMYYLDFDISGSLGFPRRACFAQVLDRSASEKPQIISSKCELLQGTTEGTEEDILDFKFKGTTEGPEEGVPGGLVPVDVNDPEVQRLAQFAVQDWEQKHGGPMKLLEVIKAEKQLVNGYLYHIQLGVSYSNIPRQICLAQVVSPFKDSEKPHVKDMKCLLL